MILWAYTVLLPAVCGKSINQVIMIVFVGKMEVKPKPSIHSTMCQYK